MDRVFYPNGKKSLRIMKISSEWNWMLMITHWMHKQRLVKTGIFSLRTCLFCTYYFLSCKVQPTSRFTGGQFFFRLAWMGMQNASWHHFNTNIHRQTCSWVNWGVDIVDLSDLWYDYSLCFIILYVTYFTLLLYFLWLSRCWNYMIKY